MVEKNISEMSNIEIKIYLENLNNEFEGKKLKLKAICEEMDKLEREYLKAKNELEIRRNLYV
jgi:hypothetical protein